MRRTLGNLPLVVLVFSLASISSFATVADAVEWIETDYGLYHQGSRWQGGSPPTSSQSAEFLQSDGGLVLWDNNTGNTQTTNVEVQLGYNTFTGCCGASGIPFTHTATDFVEIGNDGTLQLGNLPGEPMNLTTSDIILHDRGTLIAKHGSIIDSAQMSLATSSTFSIDGPGTLLYLDPTDIGAGLEGALFVNEGTVNITDKAVAAISYLRAGSSINSSIYKSNINVMNGGKLRLQGYALIGHLFDSSNNPNHSAAKLIVGGAAADGEESEVVMRGDQDFIVGDEHATGSGYVEIRDKGNLIAGKIFGVEKSGSVVVKSGGHLGFRADAVTPIQFDVNGGSIVFESGSSLELQPSLDTRVSRNGLLDLAFGANFNSNNRVYVYSGGVFRTPSVAFGDVSPGSLDVINGTLETPGLFLLGPQGKVYLNGGAIKVGAFSYFAFGEFNHYSGELIVDGGAFNIGLANYLIDAEGDAQGQPTVTLRNGATGSLPGLLAVGSPAQANLNIESGATLSGAGNFFIGGAEGNGVVTVTGSGSTFATDADLDVGEKNNGHLTIGAGATVSAGGLVTLGQIGGNGIIELSGTLEATNNIEVGGTGPGELRMRPGAFAGAATGGVYVGTLGSVVGSGEVAAATEVVNAGSIYPSFSAPGTAGGVLELNSHFLQESSGSLMIEVADGGASRIDVFGTAVLGGTLDVSYIALAAPTVGQSHEVLTAGLRTGTFDTVVLPSLNDYDPNVRLELVYTPTTVNLLVTPTLTGDFNADGRVDTADYTIWRDNLGSTTNLAADANFDLVVDSNDYALWKLHFGDVAMSLSTAGAIPEPATCISLIGLALLRLRLRRDNRG